MSRPADPVRPRANLVLAMLLGVYVFNYLDRMLLSILAAPIQQELELTDGQMGLLGGLAFAALYSTLAVPLSALADRTGRKRVIAWSLVVWSAFTALCGLAANFWQIFLARLGVGIGEAGGVAPSYAVIGEWFPPRQRASALATYSLGSPLGSAFGLLAGGYIAQAVDWRTAFIVIGLAGVAFAPLFARVVRDRPEPLEAVRLNPPPPLAATFRLLARKPSFWLLSFGAAAGSSIGYGIGFWLPSFAQRSFGLGLFDAALFVSGLLLVGGVSGILAGGRLADRMGHGDRAWYAWLPAIAYGTSAPLWATGIASTQMALAFVLLLVPQALSFVWLGPVNAAVQHLVEPAARATASALFLLINNLIGLAGGIYALGAMSDLLAPAHGEESLRVAILWALTLYLVAAALMAMAGKTLRRDWVAEGETP
jgi:MFS family permease